MDARGFVNIPPVGTRPAPEASTKRIQFNQALVREREKLGVTRGEMARRCQVSTARYVEWEEDISVPTVLEYKRLIGSLRVMRFYPPDFTALKRDNEPLAETVVEQVANAQAVGIEQAISEVEPLELPAGEESVRQLDFGAALRRERELEKLSDAELATLMGVTHGAVYFWETGRGVTRANYDKLCTLFPRLLEAKAPSIREGNPSGRAALKREQVVETPPPPSAPEVASPAVVDLVDALDRALKLTRVVHGEGWMVGVEVGREGPVAVATPSAPGAHRHFGDSVGDALNNLVESLRKTLDERIAEQRAKLEELEKLRGAY